MTDLLEFGVEFEGKEQLQEGLFVTWAKFMQGAESAQELVRRVMEYYEQCKQLGERTEDNEDVLSVDTDKFVRKFVLPLMLDLECRTRFLLSLYRTFPKFYALCCQYGHCFCCKVDQWHEGTSCEDKQQEELLIEAQFCPLCTIPTIRTDGCSDMLCVCGSSWQWQGDDDDDYSDY